MSDAAHNLVEVDLKSLAERRFFEEREYRFRTCSIRSNLVNRSGSFLSSIQQSAVSKLLNCCRIKDMNYHDYITIEPNKRGGKPCIRGLRITVYEVLEYLASGMTEEEILSDFPDLTKDDLRASIAYAADRERRLMEVPLAA